MIPSSIELARKGENPTVICQMSSGWAMFCDWQFLPGYTILLADPPVPSLNELQFEEGQLFLRDMRIIGDALLETTDAFRINYQILGNLEPFLHAHICPRYQWEKPDLRSGPIEYYNKTKGPTFDLNRDQELKGNIQKAIELRVGKTNSIK